MDPEEVAVWMQSKIVAEGCLYHEDAVAHLSQVGADNLLRCNDAGNEVLAKAVLAAFRLLTDDTVVSGPARTVLASSRTRRRPK